MFGIVHFEVFLVSAILLNLTPGVDTMYIISRSISQGRKAGVYSALGITSGALIHTILASLGLSVILMKSVFLFNLIKYFGAIYLVYLGIQMLLSKKSNQREQIELNRISNRKIFTQGLITNVTNPKVALFFLAFIPQFINQSYSSPIPFALLGITFCLTGGIWCLIIANYSSMLTRRLRKSSKMEFVLNKITGLVFIGMAVKLFQTKGAQ
ncbi:LysE family translocator [Bacillus timonensis]|nr:LysE family translocator [Bacillus timonensis]